jgi:hypothetical protein
MSERIYYRKEKLRGACWEYRIAGGWLTIPGGDDSRHVLHHRFTYYRPRVLEVRTPGGVRTMERTGAEQWFFPDRWFSLLRLLTDDDETVGYYVNFSRPLSVLRANYYRDLDLELDLWLDPDGTATELDRDEFDVEVRSARLQADWADEVEGAYREVIRAVRATLGEVGPDLDADRDRNAGMPGFILRA